MEHWSFWRLEIEPERLEARNGALELLEARNGALERLEGRNGALERLEARNGALERLDTRNGALEARGGPKWSIFVSLNLAPKWTPKATPKVTPKRTPKSTLKEPPRNRKSVVISRFSVIWDPIFGNFRGGPRGQIGSLPRPQFKPFFKGPKMAESIVYIKFGTLFGL